MSEPDRRRVLIIDDEKNLRSSLAAYLDLDGFDCLGAPSGEEGLATLERELFDAVVLDLRLPALDGLGVLARLHDAGPSVPVIMMSAHGEIADAVAAMKLGAADYLVKPFDPAELTVRLEKAIADSRLLRRASLGLRLEESRSAPVGLPTESVGDGGAITGGAALRGTSGGPWLGDDPAMRECLDLLERAAPTNSTVLITGESGTGKEVIAREIHRRSPRAAGPFVPVNVGALPESLIESELFGYEKGAFTGAGARKSGLFELASGGTLFLDELGEMPQAMQVKLLRVLQERVLTRVGGTRPIPVDLRVVAATNRDLEAAVRSGSFREDLYFRVNVIRLRLPALRDRSGDIAPLAGLFLARFAREMGKPMTGFSAEALALLTRYRFPGNIRELENLIERAVILGDSNLLEPKDFPPELRSLSAGDSPSGTGGPGALPGQDRLDASAAGSANGPISVREAEKQAVIAALARNGGHRERTAAELGISRRTLLNKMKEYGLFG